MQGPSKLLIKYFFLNTCYIKLNDLILSLRQYKKATKKILPEFRILTVTRNSRYNLLILKVLLIIYG